MSSSEIEAGLSAEPEDELVQVELDDAHRKRRTGRARIIGIVASVLVIGGVFAFALPRIADYGEVWDVVQTLSWQWIVALVLCRAPQPRDLRAAAGRGAARALVLHATRVTLASTALSWSRPAAPPSAWRRRSRCSRAWGFRGRPVGLAVVVTGVWNQFVILGFPIIALAGVAAEGGSEPHARARRDDRRSSSSSSIVAGFAVGLSSERLARRDRRPRRPPRQLGEGRSSARRR